MKIALDPVSLVILAGAVVGVFLSLAILFLKKGRLSTRLFLAGFVLSYSLGIFGAIPWQSGTISQFPFILGFFMPFVILGGPCLYLYIESLTRPGFRFGWRPALHFLPWAATFGLMFALIYVRPIAYKLDLIARMSAGSPPRGIELYYDLRIPYVLAYAAACVWRLHRYARSLPDTFSALERVGLRWLRLLAWAYTTAVALMILLGGLGVLDRLHMTDAVLHIYATAVILLVGLRGLSQPEIFAPEAAGATTAGKPGPKYEKSSLTPEAAAAAEKLLIAVMENDRLYLDDQLSLPALAVRAGLPAAHVSQVINERLGRNFFDFVNGYRVEEAKRLLRDPRRRDQKILAVAFDSGFSSKVAFNRVFKKHAGMTPSEFRGPGS